MAFVFHIIEKDHWNKAQENGSYKPDSLSKEGFIHCSKIDQILTVANSFYKGMPHLLLLKIEEGLIKEKLVYEPPLEAPNSGVNFPHIYGALNLDSVTEVFEFPISSDGAFHLPEGLFSS